MEYRVDVTNNRVYLTLSEDTAENRIAGTKEAIEKSKHLAKILYIVRNEGDPLYLRVKQDLKRYFESEVEYKRFIRDHDLFYQRIVHLISIRNVEIDRDRLVTDTGKPPEEVDLDSYERKMPGKEWSVYTETALENLLKRLEADL